MGEASNAGQTDKLEGILDQDRPLKAADFHLGDLKRATEDLGISQRTLLKEINDLRPILESHNWITESEGKLFLNYIAVELISFVRSAKKNKANKDLDVRIIALANLADYLMVTSVPHNEYMDEKERNEALLSQVSQLERENDELRERLERLEGISRIAQNHADQGLKDIEALKNLISAMTYSRVKEEEALIKKFTGGHIGEIVSPDIWERNR